MVASNEKKSHKHAAADYRDSRLGGQPGYKDNSVACIFIGHLLWVSIYLTRVRVKSSTGVFLAITGVTKPHSEMAMTLRSSSVWETELIESQRYPVRKTAGRSILRDSFIESLEMIGRGKRNIDRRSRSGPQWKCTAHPRCNMSRLCLTPVLVHGCAKDDTACGTCDPPQDIENMNRIKQQG